MSSLIELGRHPHRRYDPLRGEWVQVSPQRNDRPWQGQIDAPAAEDLPVHDAGCYLCPGSARAGGAMNPDYTSTFVFDNDFAALRAATPAASYADGELLLAQAEPGICRVVCFSPRHDLTLSRLDREAIRGVVDTWTEECARLAAAPEIGYVLVFENRGAAMGASNPHPHGQIWATATLPNEPAREQAAMGQWRAVHGRCLLCDYLALETARGERLILENDAFAAIVPFWAVWPFEILVCSRRHLGSFPEFTEAEVVLLAQLLQQVTATYDKVFDVPFPYSMGFHQSPTDGSPHHEWHFHAHFYPPLLRSATIRKFMVGFEMLGMPQRDITPESAAAHLKSLSDKP